ncbi:Stk1 family PASTA domain-containing Ser/Thr kinase [Streptomyces sp. NBC_01808]|uniref:Stk1 family PASTA domain-containing Ser/Thr kinase n=1 Tax=Streptomyces sp. NBC_01808 TaxID=2975947 RepID=UPI002DD9E846|nr:Stk1 family PASTA domain-containing Ser/Thr kinase [Streptomyces sp. NBC_01808]WSA37313.1 Stk1 family PASTA domain-containing Ser/Thr kinase [Streptomyces sp. NBC_01808]
MVGQMLDGRYRVDARIAAGGMATVYRALDTRLDRVLAVKVMHPSLAADASFVQRFILEAKSVAGLAHPNVVGVYDQGTDGPHVFLAMEYVPGCTLRDVLHDRGALQPRAALDILEPVLAALGAAHRAGFVHRDMKPENVLIGDDGRVKVADFGLVRAVNTHTTASTGAVLGSVSYLAPEQIERGAADPRVDVYACGVMLYEMLTGAKPHAGEHAAHVLYQHLHEDVEPPSAVVPGLPAQLDDLVATAAARRSEARPADAVELLSSVRSARAQLTDAELDAVPPQAVAEERIGSEDRTAVVPSSAATPAQERLNVTSVLETPAAAPPGTAAGRPPGPPAPADQARPGRPKPRLGLLALLAAVLLLGVGTGVWYINSGQFTKVPFVLGKTETEARSMLSGEDLDADVREDFSDTVKAGLVIRTDPEGGNRIRQGDSVTLVLSKGPEMVEIPELYAVPLDEAKDKLSDAGLKPGVTREAFSEELPAGRVISTDPEDGEKIKAGRAVAMVISRGAPIEVPDVVGDDQSHAAEELREEGLAVEVATETVYSEEDAGTVAETSPEPGTELGEGDKVTLTISKGPEVLEVPDVVDMSVDDAEQTLEDAGFSADVNQIFFGDTVWRQSPDDGEEAPRGSEITLWVR